MTSPVMTTWAVTYSIYSANGVQAAKDDVLAAYYDTKGPLVEFKDSGHRVVFAIRPDIVLTIRRDDTDTLPGPDNT